MKKPKHFSAVLLAAAMSMLEILRRESIYLWYYFDLQLRQIFPYWVLGMVLGSVISVFAKAHIHGLFRSLHGKRLGIWGIFAASALGIASPLCMYGTIPLAASFSESGMEDDWLAAFMMSSILLNPQLALYSMALGTTALVIRILSSFLCGAMAGLLIRWFYREHGFFNFDGFGPPRNKDIDPSLPMRLLKNLGRNVKATGPIFFWAFYSPPSFNDMCLPNWFLACLAATRVSVSSWRLPSAYRSTPAEAVLFRSFKLG